MIKVIILFLLICLIPLFSWAQPPSGQLIYSFHTPEQAQAFNRLTHDLRCLVCQNQNLAESNAGLAADLRRQIADKLKQGETSQQIIHYLVSRYGEYILYKPPLDNNTWLLWFGPVFLLIGGFIILILTILRMRKNAQIAINQSQQRESERQAQLNQLLNEEE